VQPAGTHASATAASTASAQQYYLAVSRARASRLARITAAFITVSYAQCSALQQRHPMQHVTKSHPDTATVPACRTRRFPRLFHVAVTCSCVCCGCSHGSLSIFQLLLTPPAAVSAPACVPSLLPTAQDYCRKSAFQMPCAQLEAAKKVWWKSCPGVAQVGEWLCSCTVLCAAAHQQQTVCSTQ
jgi:hypothetical protein